MSYMMLSGLPRLVGALHPPLHPFLHPLLLPLIILLLLPLLLSSFKDLGLTYLESCTAR